MTRLQYFVAALVSLGALGLIATRKLYPSFPVDTTTIGLFGLAVLPWLTLFFKKFKIPGIVEGESHDRIQGTAKPKAPTLVTATNEIASPSPPNALFQELPPDSQKILRTLWRYQRQLFKGDYGKRWTFAVLPNSPSYSSYLMGLAPLINKGVVAVPPDLNQCALTNEGVIFMENLDDSDIKGDFYVY